MLIVALMMVLFANHMDERLSRGKRVIWCGGLRARTNVFIGKRDNDRKPLLVNSAKEAGEDSADNISP